MYDALATSDATAKLRRAAAPALTGLFFAALGTTAHAQTAIAPGYSLSIFAAGAAIHATGADSLTVAGGDVFVGYANGVDSAGAGGKATSTIAEYTVGGKLERTYKLVGGNDGLRVDPQTGLLWVLQNQDGNSVLDVIVFNGDTAYLSATNLATPNDVVLYETSTRLPEPGDPVRLTSLLAAGTLVDTDSLALTPGGNLLLDDQGGAPLGTAPLPSLTLVTSPGRTEQKTSLLFPKDEAGKPISLDDTRFAPSGARRLLIADTKNNVVYLLSGPFRANEVYCATKGTGTVGALNLSTGVVTPLVGGPGSPHGLAFITGLSC